MEISFHYSGVEWIRALNFDTSSFGVRDKALQCHVTEVPELDWTVFNFLAPMGTGLWLLRVYRAFDGALRDIYSTRRGSEIDEEGVEKFEAVLRKHRIAKRSEAAARCFGLYPRLWGHRFGPPGGNGLIPHRFLSVSVPTGSADEVHRHFVAQVGEFGPRSVAPAGEEVVLFISSEMASTAEGRLLLQPASSMSDRERLAVRDGLSELVERPDVRDKFARNLAPAMKFSGAFRAPDRRDLLVGKEDECLEISRLRVRLMCRLRWPHALESMRAAMNDAAREQFSDAASEIEAALSTFSTVRLNPLFGASA